MSIQGTGDLERFNFCNEIDLKIEQINKELSLLGKGLVAIEKKLIGIPKADESKAMDREQPRGWLQFKIQELGDILDKVHFLREGTVMRVWKKIEVSDERN